jgi:RimJ/RimL family protein N-acetyltransferase
MSFSDHHKYINHKTPRLTIRKLELADIDSLIDLFSSQKVMQFIGPRRVMSVTEIADWLNSQLAMQQSEITRYAVSLSGTNELIGVCGFQKINEVLDFGYFFREAYWGNGYATEACQYLLNHVTEFISERDFQIFIAEENVASRKVIERCGYIPLTKTIKNGEIGWEYQKPG